MGRGWGQERSGDTKGKLDSAFLIEEPLKAIQRVVEGTL
jgi:hypothetical protein